MLFGLLTFFKARHEKLKRVMTFPAGVELGSFDCRVECYRLTSSGTRCFDARRYTCGNVPRARAYTCAQSCNGRLHLPALISACYDHRSIIAATEPEYELTINGDGDWGRKCTSDKIHVYSAKEGGRVGGNRPPFTSFASKFSDEYNELWRIVASWKFPTVVFCET